MPLMVKGGFPEWNHRELEIPLISRTSEHCWVTCGVCALGLVLAEGITGSVCWDCRDLCAGVESCQGGEQPFEERLYDDLLEKKKDV